MKLSDYLWPVIGLIAVAVSAYLLYKEVRGLSLDELLGSFAAISALHWMQAAIAAVVAYGALAYYDRLALMHLGRQVPWPFVALTSFTTYALSHNVGASVLSGAVVRYRAYRSRGLSRAEIGILVAFCSFTFALGTVLLFGVLMIVEPQIMRPYVEVDHALLRGLGIGLIALVGLYVLGSWLHFRPLAIGALHVTYPRLPIVARQLVTAPVEILAAAAIIYFALPDAGNPGYARVLGVFVVAFSLALVSHAPGGLGVLEFAFLTGLPREDEADLLAALIVFRILYLLVPFAISIVVVLWFERRELLRKLKPSRG